MLVTSSFAACPRQVTQKTSRAEKTSKWSLQIDPYLLEHVLGMNVAQERNIHHMNCALIQGSRSRQIPVCRESLQDSVIKLHVFEISDQQNTMAFTCNHNLYGDFSKHVIFMIRMILAFSMTILDTFLYIGEVGVKGC